MLSRLGMHMGIEQLSCGGQADALDSCAAQRCVPLPASRSLVGPSLGFLEKVKSGTACVLGDVEGGSRCCGMTARNAHRCQNDSGAHPAIVRGLWEHMAISPCSPVPAWNLAPQA